MKNIGFLLIMILGLSSIAYGQKGSVTEYWKIESNEKSKHVLDKIENYKWFRKYSKINKELVKGEGVLMKKDTQVWYTLTNGKVYKAKRRTPALNK